MKIHAYALCWNEEAMLPYYLRHYEKFCDKIIIYDNMSTDRSQQIILNHPLCELRTYDSQEKIRDDLYLEIKNNVWKECRGKGIDYVIVGDMDEFVFHNDLKHFLEKNKKYSIFEPVGIEMVSLNFPQTDDQIYSVVNTGLYEWEFCKKIIFSPDRVQEISFIPGCHHHKDSAEISKHPIWIYNSDNYYPSKDPLKSELKLLHFKFIGIDYVNERHKLMAKRLSKFNIEEGTRIKGQPYGHHYYNDATEVIKKFTNNSIKIF